eukprot:scaffold14911_cov54-Attheya_sp.AAC.1
MSNDPAANGGGTSKVPKMESSEELLHISSCSSPLESGGLRNSTISQRISLLQHMHHCQHEEHDRRRNAASFVVSRRMRGQTSNSNHDIGYHIDKAKGHAEDGKSAYGRNMWYVVTTIFVSFLVLHGAVLLLSELVLDKLYPDYNNKKYFTEFVNPYDDIVMGTIPYVQDWYHELDTSTKPLLPPPTRSNETTSKGKECIQDWFANIEDAVAYSSPLLIEVVLMTIGLSDSNLVRIHFNTLLTEPQPLSFMLASSSKCLQFNIPMSQLCSALDDLGAMPSSGTSEQQNILEYLVHVFVVYERLTSIATTDFALLSELVGQFKYRQT